MYFQAFDQHLNMILSEDEETISTVETDEETLQRTFQGKIHSQNLDSQTLSFILDWGLMDYAGTMWSNNTISGASGIMSA